MLQSFELAGATMTDVQKDIVFQRIYSIFGSQAAYERFDDALPFLQWANRNQITCGLLSNADDRYRKGGARARNLSWLVQRFTHNFDFTQLLYR